MPTLTVLMGAPGAGKTTYAARHSGGALVCSTDRLRTDRGLSRAGAVAYIGGLRSRAAAQLADGGDVVADGCNVRRGDRTRWLQLARERHATPVLVVLHAPLATLLQAQHGRAQPVPAVIVRRYLDDLEVALRVVDLEGWAEVAHVHRGGDGQAGDGQAARWVVGGTP